MLRALARRPAAALSRGEHHDLAGRIGAWAHHRSFAAGARLAFRRGLLLLPIATLLFLASLPNVGDARTAMTVERRLPPAAPAVLSRKIDALPFDWSGRTYFATVFAPAQVVADLPPLSPIDLAAVLRGPSPDRVAAGDNIPLNAPAAPVNIGTAIAPEPGRRFENVNITFYDCSVQQFCGKMYGGLRVYEGAAACSFDLPLGTRFRVVGDPTGHAYRCDDRGLLRNTWVDIFFFNQPDGYNWAGDVGRFGAIEIVGSSLP